ncbi:2-amino-4-hydroxy-6-hydroxymethyldihydropteridine diphosphokinase [Salegentibacter salegens]|uniref:2-amino-4-hydroxy-6-hydroxymethyldihydropteridine pyrophosphokinase n=1 Tax=Salegentibacter salegens TaxID=143223 RepID=A0A1M7I4Q1_9FLAO|nr:2-amino-4-hydroxy-6-hydroxymethyldihydropteridine diphosphokinase [Salegentibacter salegens]PRX42846.1 2-amino-4-hydroxy-6-hydroxymethyldihydropteridine diphosphokinase [Salegentibacter salegens]SHM35771.1 2-amino-4-hydroxy-6-hydroxymethyldihydropteridinediphosphokinase [Salegentibacter salegens]
MNSPKIVHIALGSNVGNRFELLQNALHKIYLEIGEVQLVSQVYETPAWGFEGNAFLNACIAVSTRFSAEEILRKLLKIEADAGRVRSDAKNYQNRSLDLDILLFENEILETTDLVVPHPAMQNRKFVLLPLADIATKEIHPVFKVSIEKLLKRVEDNSEIKAISERLEVPKKAFNLNKLNYIAVEGNIGAGKTSFSTMVSEDFNAKLILERFKDNPFLPKFYENKERYAFPLEMSFLADRYQQLSDDLAQYDLFKDFVISDYDVFKSLIFAKITLHEDEYALYHKLFHLMYKELVKPDLYIYLYQNTDRLLENIKTRGRDYEQNIQPDYLVEINKSYLNFIKTQTNMKVQIIDISGKDFVNNRADYLAILDEIKKAP